jgi:hypothetical protein
MEDLPAVEPRQRLVLSICFLQMRPQLSSVLVHCRKPVLFSLDCFHPLQQLMAYLARLRIVLAIDPPHALTCQIILEPKQQVCAGHCATREKVLRHPPVLKVVRTVLVCENVYKQLSSRLEQSRNLA